MLGRLIKHEYKATWKIMCAVYAAVAAVTIIGGLFYKFRLGVFEKLQESGVLSEAGFSEGLMNSLMAMITSAYVLILIAASVGTVWFLAYRFFKSCYGDEGYLTQMLPAQKHDIILSKTITAWTWIFGETLLTIVSILNFVFVAIGENADILDVAEVVEEMNDIFDIGTLPIILTVLVWLVDSVAEILKVYAAISLGQTSGKHKVLMSILWYVAFYIMIQIAGSVIFAAGSMFSLMRADTMPSEAVFRSVYDGILFGTLIINLVICALGYLVTRYGMERNLNLE